MVVNTQINTGLNASGVIPGGTKGIVQYNNIDLTSLVNATTGYMIETGNELSLTNIKIQDFESKVVDGGTVVNKIYGNKDISFTLFIQGSSNADLITKIQALKQELNAINGKLYITRQGIAYSYEATCISIIVPDFRTTDDFVDNVQLGFRLTSPHGIIEEAVVAQTTNTANFQSIINNLGNYKTYPKIIIVGKATNALTTLTIDIKLIGQVTGIPITITQVIGNGDVLIIDYKLKTVTINGTEIVYTGFLAPLQAGNNIVDFVFTGTVNIDTTILYNKTYL